jgi:8-oxo-dGTP pyrophosphatase MutT (NUDIX family)
LNDTLSFLPEPFESHLRRRFDAALTGVVARTDARGAAVAGDHVLNGMRLQDAFIDGALPAAVLVPVVARPAGVTLLLTKRADALRQHSGQIAFPGGKIDTGETPLQAALREADEEIGLGALHVTPLGVLEPYVSSTGFHITPVVAMVGADFALELNPGEVDEAFEVPLSFVLDAANYRVESREWKGRARNFYALHYGDRYIWGVTAGIIRKFYERVL